MLLRLHKKQKKGRLEVDPAKRLRDPNYIGAKRVSVFATDQCSYGNTLPTESQRYRGNGVLKVPSKVIDCGRILVQKVMFKSLLTDKSLTEPRKTTQRSRIISLVSKVIQLFRGI